MDLKGKPVPDKMLKFITLNITEMSLADAIAEIERLGDIHVNYSSRIVPADAKVTLQLRDVPVVEALRKMIQKAGLDFILAQGDQIVLVLPNSFDFFNKYTISGFVTDSRTGEALVETSVFVEELQAGCVTNAYGFYSLTLPSGQYQVQYSRVGYTMEERSCFLDENQWCHVRLNEIPIELGSVTVVAEKADANVETNEMGTIQFNPEKMISVPVLLGEKDILRTLQMLPGITQVREGDAGLYVRGGDSDQNLVLLDEAPVYNAFHLLGTFSVFNSDAIRNVKLYKASAPSKYGGKLSSVLDVQMNEGNNRKMTGSGGLGLIFSRLMIEGPLGEDKGSFMLAGRRTYADLFLKLSSDPDLKNNKLYFYDLNLKTNWLVSPKNRFFLSVYLGRDVLFVAGDASASDIDISWGNKTATLRWNHLFNEKIFLNTSLIASSFEYVMSIVSSDDPGEDDISTTSLIDDWTLKEDFEYFINPANRLNFGIQYIYHNYQPAEMTIEGEQDFQFVIGKRNAHEGAVYLSHTWNGSRIKLETGLRWNIFHSFLREDNISEDFFDEIPDEFYGILFHQKESSTYQGLEPRISATVLLGASGSLKFGFTRNYQNVHLLSKSLTGTPLDVWQPSNSILKPQRCDQFSIGYYRNFLDNTVEFSLEGFYKSLANQSDLRDGANLILGTFFESELAFGLGQAYGVEFFLRKKLGRFNGWIGYTISRSEKQIEEINGGKFYPSRFDRTHDFKCSGTYHPSERWTLSANWVYGTGTPMTVPQAKYAVDGNIQTLYSERNAYRLPAYHRLDLGLMLTTKKSGSWTFTLYNAYGRKNAYMIYFREEQSGLMGNFEAVKLSLFSILPSITYSFTF